MGYPPNNSDDCCRSVGGGGRPPNNQYSYLNNPSVGQGPLSFQMPGAPGDQGGSAGYGGGEPGGFMISSSPPNSFGGGFGTYPPQQNFGHGGGFSPQNSYNGGGYPPQQPGFRPNIGGYPPHNYRPSGGGYNSQQQSFGPGDGGYPPRHNFGGGGYPPQNPNQPMNMGMRPPLNPNQSQNMGMGQPQNMGPPPNMGMRPQQNMNQSQNMGMAQSGYMGSPQGSVGGPMNGGAPPPPPPKAGGNSGQQPQKQGGPEPPAGPRPSAYQGSRGDSLSWSAVSNQHAQLPSDAIRAGTYKHEGFFIGRRKHKDSIQVGMVCESKGGLVVAYDGKGLLFRDGYEVLCGPSSLVKWVPVSGKMDPAKLVDKTHQPLVCGSEKNGEKLYAATTTTLSGRDYAGKTSAKAKSIIFVQDGGEHRAKDYFVLCEAKVAVPAR
ncbi:hypothetical protein IWW37_005270 [Coemansia sp. RSA 2050]|nr:hypothetical protein IWW37_005270 [Coemansia sp. RSA 2050]KAJ2730444.1 hypothetical protein IW152_005244 [Coemansia sp. BCRC 34962]